MFITVCETRLADTFPFTQIEDFDLEFDDYNSMHKNYLKQGSYRGLRKKFPKFSLILYQTF